MNESTSSPRLIEAGIAVDDRGQLLFANQFDFNGVKRFYIVTNHSCRFVRAWHAHKREAKYVLPLRGASVVGAVLIDDWQNPGKDQTVHRYVLSANKPSILYIPPGFANGFMSLTDDSQLMFFSTSSIDESRGDDIRYDARYWDIWRVEER